MAAKQKALAEGQQAAFRSLLKRLMPVMAYPRAKQFASVKAVELVEGVKVRSERNSATEYSATYDFYFRPKSVRDLLRREGIPFTDEQAPVATLIPVWQAASTRPGTRPRGSTTGRGSIWRTRSRRSRSSRSGGTCALMRSPLLSAGDVGAMRALATQYKTEHVLVAVAEPDAANGRLAVTLAGRDAVGRLRPQAPIPRRRR